MIKQGGEEGEKFPVPQKCFLLLEMNGEVTKNKASLDFSQRLEIQTVNEN